MKTINVITHIINWLDNYCNKSNLKGFIIGVSGGIDSAVTSTLCAKTQKKTIVINMPIHRHSVKHCSLSQNHIDWLEKKFDNVKGFKTDLSSAFQTLEKSLPDNIQDDLTMANTQSRLRMLTLYAFASHHKMLVVGTGNKIEDFGVGFYTKYGDGAVDISPIADLVKSEVYAIGRELGIIDEILKASPADGLWDDDRTDESQLGATYPELEWAMNFEASQKNSLQLSKREKEVLKIYKKFNSANRHKMEPIPICKIQDL